MTSDKPTWIGVIDDFYNCCSVQMYRKRYKRHLFSEHYHVLFGGTLKPDNRWAVLFASLIPLEELKNICPYRGPVATRPPQMRHLRTSPWSGQATTESLLQSLSPCLPLRGSVSTTHSASEQSVCLIVLIETRYFLTLIV